MITARDIMTQQFEQVKMGYKPEDVDNFLQALANQTAELLNEREGTEEKIQVLVDSIRQYKSEEDAVKDAVITAHKQARSILDEAQQKAAEIISEAQQRAEMIISDANIKSDEIVGDTADRAKREEKHLLEMQNATKEFKRNIIEMYRAHFELIANLPGDDDDEDEDEYDEMQDNEEAFDEAAQMQNDYDMEVTKVIDTAAIENALNN